MNKRLTDREWLVLTSVYWDIKRKAFFTPGGKEITYSLTEKILPIQTPQIESEELVVAIYMLQDEKAILVREEYTSAAGNAWKIKLLPKFNEFLYKLLGSDKSNIVGSGVLTWGVITVNIKSGRASVAGKPHLFEVDKSSFKIFKALLEKRAYDQSNSEVTYNEFTKVSGIKDKETIKLKIREMRRQFGISRKKNPLEDIFQETGNGFRLIQPETFK